MSAMTASGSKHPRQPHEIPLPISPELLTLQQKSSKKRKSGKEQEPGTLLPQRLDASDGEWDHAKAGTKPWKWMSLTDSSASKHPPVFTKDGCYFFAIAGSCIKVHSSATGQVVSTLSDSSPESQATGTHFDAITSAILNPNNAFQLITGSLSGLIKIWDFLDAVLLRTINIEAPIFHVCAHENFPDHVFIAAAKSTKGKSGQGDEKDKNGVVLRVSLKPRVTSTNSKMLTSSNVVPVGKTRHVVGLSLSSSGSWLVAVAGHKAYVASTSSLKLGFTKYVSPEALTCLAFHPSEDYFATGDDKGSIRLWYCLNDQVAASATGVEKRAQTTTLHWHAHAVASIAFTPNGAYLLSGGEESVLVIWQLHTGKKEFIPRVGAPINTIAVTKGGESEEYLVGLADATFTFISAATLKVSRSYSRIKLDPAASYFSSPTSNSTPLAVHSATSTLILPSSHPSSLQLYAPSTSTLVGELEISPSNKVSRRDEQPIEPSHVESAAVSASGEWMATVDVRDGDDAFRGEIYLKFWRWNSISGSWVLNTRIDRPHGTERVTCAAFSPEVKYRHNLMLVTTGDDRNIKVWRLRAIAEKTGDVEESWVPRSSSSFRGQRPTHASWSPDGSLFCIAMGPSVNLYDSASNILRRVLTSPDCNATSAAHFVGRSGRHLVVVGLWDVILWDLSAQGVRWHCKNPWPIDHVITHPRDDTFALLHCSSVSPRTGRHVTPVTLLSPSSPLPYGKYTVPFGFLQAVWYPTSSGLQPNSTSFSLVGIVNNHSVVLFGDDVSAPADEGSTAKATVAGAVGARKTLFQDIFGVSAFADPSLGIRSSVAQQGVALPWSGNDTSALFDAPAYLMPPIASLYEPLMNGFIKQRSATTKQPDEPNGQLDDDVEMAGQSDDDVIIIGAQRERVVDDEEMRLFVDLFKRTKVSSNQTITTKSHILTNGVHTKTVALVISTPKSNGILTPRSAPTMVKDAATPSTSDGKKSHKRRRPSEGS